MLYSANQNFHKKKYSQLVVEQNLHTQVQMHSYFREKKVHLVNCTGVGNNLHTSPLTTATPGLTPSPAW